MIVSGTEVTRVSADVLELTRQTMPILWILAGWLAGCLLACPAELSLNWQKERFGEGLKVKRHQHPLDPFGLAEQCSAVRCDLAQVA